MHAQLYHPRLHKYRIFLCGGGTVSVSPVSRTVSDMHSNLCISCDSTNNLPRVCPYHVARADLLSHGTLGFFHCGTFIHHFTANGGALDSAPPLSGVRALRCLRSILLLPLSAAILGTVGLVLC